MKRLARFAPLVVMLAAWPGAAGLKPRRRAAEASAS
jgi:hypothetical protein